MFALCLSKNVSRSFLKQIWLFTGEHEAFQKSLANQIVSRSPRTKADMSSCILSSFPLPQTRDAVIHKLFTSPKISGLTPNCGSGMARRPIVAPT
jgi:hypothetical protein